MDNAEPRVNEAASEVHKALMKEISSNPDSGRSSSEATNYDTFSGTQQRKPSTARFDRDKPKEEISKLKEPGGFRRHYLNTQADEAGIPEEQRPAAWKSSFMQNIRPLVHMGYFDSILGTRLDPETGAEMAHEEGSIGTTATVLALLKCYIGSGITFTPGAFSQGGWLFCIACLIIMGIVNMMCIWMLIEVKTRTGHHGLGEMGQAALGTVGKKVVQISLVVSQYGTCIAYIIFTCELARSMVDIDRAYIVVMQGAFLVPLALIRTVENLEYPNLIADFLVLAGLLIMCVSFAHHMNTSGPAHDFKPFKGSTCGLFIGTAIFSFEGTPMLMPIANSMAEPQRFWPIFLKVFTCVIGIFIAFGVIGYACYGQDADTVVLLNLPHREVGSVTKVAYMFALTLSWPLMFLPAIRTVELWMYGVGNKAKHKKSMDIARIVQVVIFAVIAVVCAEAFEKFIAVAGALCDGPIMLLYPPLFHLILCANTFSEKFIDTTLIVFGSAAIIFCLTHLDS
eukprot:gnl/TRDRNA2_/TRDRNA2_184774_c0_seq1.p1 gnl/TRDRNA2_/TRDRNA2_184774_c0~~gnl/TRDRNA2_/TRDRNA2_184774_c0_seq1.p1  ORF type:complete len:510 (-),score=101.52 gnl/TRDRNA2_/TRDRNA2_184774_c0_seq1:86-1615(-)